MKPTKKALLLLGVLCLSACRGVLEVHVEQERASPPPPLGKVAYVAGGDVWALDLDSEQRTRLTRDGRNSYPAWSADGRWIAYSKDDILWAFDTSQGKERAISETSTAQFAWSPAGERLAYLSPAGVLDLWDASEQRSQILVPADPAATLIRFAWNRDGNGLVYEAQGVWSSRLGEVSLHGTSSTLYESANSQRAPHLADWSPDGRWLLFWAGPLSSEAEMDGLPFCLLAAGGAPRCLQEKVLLHADGFSWSPENRLAFAAGGGRETWVNKGLAWVDPRDTPLTLNWLVKPEEQAVSYPAWSPDGRRVAYSAGPPVAAAQAYERRDAALAARGIWTVDVAGGKKTQLTHDEGYRDERPLWSNDGGHLLFARLGQGGASLWLMEPDGGAMKRVVDELTPLPDATGEYGYIDWSSWYDWWRVPVAPQVPAAPLASPTWTATLKVTPEALPSGLPLPGSPTRGPATSDEGR